MGRDDGIPRSSPSCRRRSRKPASRRAARENGGVLISPRNQTSGFGTAIDDQHMSEQTYSQPAPPLRVSAPPREYVLSITTPRAEGTYVPVSLSSISSHEKETP